MGKILSSKISVANLSHFLTKVSRRRRAHFRIVSGNPNHAEHIVKTVSAHVQPCLYARHIIDSDESRKCSVGWLEKGPSSKFAWQPLFLAYLNPSKTLPKNKIWTVGKSSTASLKILCFAHFRKK
jgi:hypothetical protein